MKWKREIKPSRAVVETVSPGQLGDAREWLQTQATSQQYKVHNLKWLLAHADDGVIWGRLDNGKLITSDSVAGDVSPELRAETLQSARLFSSQAELLLWRDGTNEWHARLISEATHGGDLVGNNAFDEGYILWGTDVEDKGDDFTLMRDGAQGLRHVVPMKVPGKFSEQNRPLRLCVRHYVEADESGFMRVVASRLFDLNV